ncbi:30S ribosomal protein S27ae [Candidatus Pacearchaeota archaeon]|jgi:ribosomal protein S27AE|nr:30S ribosomal protein S27ae [Candidatus Pacearchaeota archaeon]|tara:strand:+ start:3337 stop:3549 length:213 start_codon:yes stop_codon:yes gene_type:complete
MAQKKDAKGKKAAKNKPTSKKYTKYKIDGDKITKEKSCTRCGPGIFLMKTNNRLYCGKCHYTEFLSEKKK